VDALKTHFRIELDAPYEQLRPLPKKGLDDGYVVQPNKNSGSVDEKEISGPYRQTGRSLPSGVAWRQFVWFADWGIAWEYWIGLRSIAFSVL
jgi:hypothetical protein